MHGSTISQVGLRVFNLTPPKFTMVRVFVRHKVKNYAKWKAVFDAFKGNRKAGGEKSAKIGNIAGSPNNLCVVFGWDSVANAKAFMKSKELRAAMAEAGVRDKPDIFIYEDK